MGSWVSTTYYIGKPANLEHQGFEQAHNQQEIIRSIKLGPWFKVSSISVNRCAVEIEAMNRGGDDLAPEFEEYLKDCYVVRDYFDSVGYMGRSVQIKGVTIFDERWECNEDIEWNGFQTVDGIDPESSAFLAELWREIKVEPRPDAMETAIANFRRAKFKRKLHQK